MRTCINCYREVENRGVPSMGGNHEVRWVHVPGGYSVCEPSAPGSPRAEPNMCEHPQEARAWEGWNSSIEFCIDCGEDVGQDGAPAGRCTSCEHETRFHDAGGRCWFTVEQGVPEKDAVCACLIRPEVVE